MKYLQYTMAYTGNLYYRFYSFYKFVVKIAKKIGKKPLH